MVIMSLYIYTHTFTKINMKMPSLCEVSY